MSWVMIGMWMAAGLGCVASPGAGASGASSTDAEGATSSVVLEEPFGGGVLDLRDPVAFALRLSSDLAALHDFYLICPNGQGMWLDEWLRQESLLADRDLIGDGRFAIGRMEQGTLTALSLIGEEAEACVPRCYRCTDGALICSRSCETNGFHTDARGQHERLPPSGGGSGSSGGSDGDGDGDGSGSLPGADGHNSGDGRGDRSGTPSSGGSSDGPSGGSGGPRF